MDRTVDVLRGAVSAVRGWFSTLASQSERNVLLGTVLLASAISAATGFVLTQYYSVDVLSSLVSVPEDCFLDWGMRLGRHCFNDYAAVTAAVARPNPWAPPFHLAYPAAGLVPHMIFAAPAAWLHAPWLGLCGYLLALTTAFLTPAVWAARGARGLERIVVFVACGIAATPAWMAIDRANSVGFVAPIALVFLVALCRRRWRLAAIMVVLAALVKPQFAVLAFALFAARRWRLGSLTVAGTAIGNIAAFLLWPRDFPETITQSIHNILGYGSFESSVD